jgi:cytochrome c5
MDKRKRILAFVFIMVLLTSTLLTACASSTSSSSSAPLDGQALLEQRCTDCHDISGITRMHGNAQQWASIVNQMVRRGAQLNAQEKQTLIDYLAQTYP